MGEVYFQCLTLLTWLTPSPFPFTLLKMKPYPVHHYQVGPKGFTAVQPVSDKSAKENKL